MDFDSHLLDLLDVAAVGAVIAPGTRLTGVSSEVGLRLSFEVDGVDVQVEIAPASTGRRYAARTDRLLFSYRTGPGPAALDPRRARELCVLVAARCAPREAAVLAALARDAAAARVQSDGDVRVREVRVARLLEPAGTPGERYYTLSPYVGCLVGCRFCYAQSHVAIVRAIEQLPEVPWGSYVDARVNAAEVLARELAERPALPVKFCPIVSDPYQAVEKRYGLTRACLEVLRDTRPARDTYVLTRSRMITRDVDVLAAMPRAWAGASIPTADDEVRRHFEPRGASIAERFAALATLRAAGVRTFAIVQPMLPGPVDALADALAATVSSARLDVLHGVEGAARDFADPRFSVAADPAWQAERIAALAEALVARGVVLWPGELPPATAQ